MFHISKVIDAWDENFTALPEARMNKKYQQAEQILDHATIMLDNGYDSFTVYNKIDQQLLTIGLNEYDLRRYRERLKAITGVRE